MKVKNMKPEELCRCLIENHEYDKCEKEIVKAIEKDSHSPIHHNLMVI